MNGREKELPEQVVVRMTDEMRAQLQRDADEYERTLAQTIRLACRRYLEGES
jgi:predicted DNA-binding protein